MTIMIMEGSERYPYVWRSSVHEACYRLHFGVVMVFVDCYEGNDIDILVTILTYGRCS